MTTHPVGGLDTNVVVLLGRLRAQELPGEPVISTVTLAELSVGPLATDDLTERAARQARLQETEAAFDQLAFDAASARAFGRLAAGLRRSGPEVRPRALDVLIASVAAANGLPLHTCNPSDFTGMEDLTLVAVPHPDA